MEIKGKIIRVFPYQEGISRNGKQWMKQEYLLETRDTVLTTFKFELFGDLVHKYPMAVGDIVTLDISIESREYNGRWYTNVHAYHATLHQQATIDNGHEQ